MVTQCPKCRLACSQDSRFCEECGTDLRSGPAPMGQTVKMTSVPPPLPGTGAPRPSVFVPLSGSPSQVILARETARRSYTVGGQREHCTLVTDHSGSMGEMYDGRMNKLEAAIRADIALIVEKAQLDSHDEIGLVVFDDQAEVIHSLAPLHSHRVSLIKAAESCTVSGGTDIREGLDKAAGLFNWSSNGIVRRIVLLTDGHGGHPLSLARDLKSRGVIIDVVGVGPNPRQVDEKLLRKVASVVQGELRYRFITDSRTLCRTYAGLATKTRVSTPAEMLQ